MRLTQLHIKGFKSFANETILNFNENVIGVVGPNGSGKSNIVDAIRWVLGEQKSRELRLERMSDIIFNGTKKRKKSGVAQVSLTFDNTKNVIPTEYDSVTISRYLYQSGESEYRLNNVPCRLKDITSLFLDTGIGSNSYAIIALGMVDDILADKEQARRKMFEQAAGIAKYKKRKKETLNKLNTTTADLERVEDLLFELNQNLKSLEKQASRAKKYKELKTEYKRLSIQASGENLKKFRSKIESLTSKISIEEDKHRGLSAEKIEAEANLEKEKAQHIEKEQNLSEFQKLVNAMLDENRGLENDKNVTSEKLGFSKKRVAEIEEELDKSQNQRESISTVNAEQEIKIGQLETEVEQQKVLAAEYETQYEAKRADYDRLKSQADQISEEQLKMQTAIIDAEKIKAVLENRIGSLFQEIQLVESDFGLRSKTIVQKEGELQGIVEQRNLSANNLAVLQGNKDELKKRIDEIDAEIEGEIKNEKTVSRKLDATQHEYDLLKNMVDNLEGYPESIKYLNQNWSQDVPVLADLIYANDEVRGVVEQYLEPYLNYFVVQDLDRAKEAIQLLSNTQKGKANFFLLNKFSPLENVSVPPMGCTNVVDELRIDNEYQNLINYLLKDVYLFDGSIHDLTESQHGQATILARSGQFIKKSNAVAGGSVGLFEGSKIGRKKHLEKLSDNIKSTSQDLKLVKEKIEHLESEKAALSVGEVEQRIDQCHQEVRNFDSKIIQLETYLTSLRETSGGLNSRLLSFQNEHSRLQAELVTTDQKIGGQKEGLSSFKSEMNIEDGELDHLSQVLANASSKLNDAKIALIKKEGEFLAASKELEFNKERLHELEQSILTNSELRINLNAEIEILVNKSTSLEEKLKVAYENLGTKQKDLNEAEQFYFQARSIIYEKEDIVKELNKKLSSSQVLINEQKDAFNDARFKMNGVVERLKIEFNIEEDELANFEFEDELSSTELNTIVAKLKRKMENYGEINPMAVDAYSEMQLRYESIHAQREDILQAKENLLETIQEIEQTASEKFLDALNQVRVHFKNVFRSLFTEEDDCDLVLLDSTSPLEANIEIIAKPKGKKPKSLSQLSGGEKTLTAIALLFSLYLLKPAPFCIFDEVDAPLDDANTQKFNKIVNQFSKNSQFIVVTHNKMTMAEVDILYGVYMQEQGISNVSAVDFRNYEYDPNFQVV